MHVFVLPFLRRELFLYQHRLQFVSPMKHPGAWSCQTHEIPWAFWYDHKKQRLLCQFLWNGDAKSVTEEISSASPSLPNFEDSFDGLAAGIQLDTTYYICISSCIGSRRVCNGAQWGAAKSQLLQFIVIVIAMTTDKASQLRVPMRGWVDLSMTMSPISSRIDTQTGILTTQCGWHNFW